MFVLSEESIGRTCWCRVNNSERFSTINAKLGITYAKRSINLQASGLIRNSVIIEIHFLMEVGTCVVV